MPSNGTLDCLLRDRKPTGEVEVTFRAFERVFLIAGILTGFVATTSHAADEIRAGKWQFTTEMRMPAGMQPTAGGQVQPGGATNMTRTACISPANPIPAGTEGNVQCKVDQEQRNGGTVSWSMTCSPPQGKAVRSDGVAHYAGNAMEATFTTHLTTPDGRAIDNPGRITGRYLGACDRNN
jgi:Protein of unknown function (DUF3617)